MRQRRLPLAVVILTLFAASNLLSCGYKRKLVAITIQPPTSTFLSNDPSGQIVYTAFGSYLHPPDTRDITKQVTWKTDVPQLVTVNGGVVSPQPGGVCGIADISATLQDGGNLIIGFATVTVDDPTNPICPGGGNQSAVLTVSLAGTQQGGTVTSVPAGISCPGQACGALFTIGDPVVLTATPKTGFTFGGWSGDCTSTNGTACTVVMTKAGAAVIATFN
jgi:uncharacterized repeat protein (TIGR02543 family)